MGPEIEQHMRAALQEAASAGAAGELPIGAVLVRRDAVATRGRSRQIERGSPLAHAELEALLAVGDRLDGDATLVTTVEPCLMCLGAAIRLGVRRIVFGAANTNAGIHALSDSPSTELYLGGVLERESLALLALYRPGLKL